MKMKKPGRFDEEVSAIGFGSWGISGAWGEMDEQAYIRTVHAAVDNGITFFDTAPIYGMGVSEEILGKAIEGRRDKLFIASKCGLVWNKKKRVRKDLTPASLRREIDESLQRLRTDHLDLWQIHWPDENSDHDAAFKTLAEIRDSGKVRFLGLSNFSAADLERAHKMVGIDSYQGLFNMFEQNGEKYHGIDLDYRVKKEILPILRREGMALLPYSPLMQGMLAGGISRDTSFAKGDVRAHNGKLSAENRGKYLEILDKLKPVAGDHNLSLAQLALVWTLNVDAVGSVIAGARSEKHVLSNAQAADAPGQEQIVAEVEAVLSEYRTLIE